MFSIKHKIMLAFGGLLAVVVAIGALTMAQLDQLGQAIDVILKENYRSVVACQDMKEALERIDSGILYTLAGNEAEGQQLIGKYTPRFLEALEVERNNITLPGEREKADRIQSLFEEFCRVMPDVTSATRPREARNSDYFAKAQPLFLDIKDAAQHILLLNQTNMSEANNAARRLAGAVHLRMMFAILLSAILVFVYSFWAQRWILRPIKRLIESTNEIRQGNLDLVLEAGSRDEIGQLSESFNEMASALRQVRKEDRINLMRTRYATEQVFRVLPSAIAVFDLDGNVEVATESADEYFGLRPGVRAEDLGYEWLRPLTRQALQEGRAVVRDPDSGYVQQFVGHREYFFQPMAVPIPVGPAEAEPSGVALILKDVTQVHEQQELKRGVVTTVSHQLKTPLTSLRMSLHLLLEERIGPLNEKQGELLITAREDTERLVDILDDLLDLNRIEAGSSYVSPMPVSPLALVRDAIDRFAVEARDKGITLVNGIADELPDVTADAGKIRHVFDNLLTNALRYTSPGGSITIQAFRRPDCVHFSVADTGRGIPAEYVPHVFEQFYRVPGQDEKSGVGLGLAIVKEIVSAHNGNVSVESEPGRGSIFHFTLPLNPEAAT